MAVTYDSARSSTDRKGCFLKMLGEYIGKC